MLNHKTFIQKATWSWFYPKGIMTHDLFKPSLVLIVVSTLFISSKAT